MYLSRLALDLERREVIRTLSSPQAIHGTIVQSLQDKSQRSLWRIDWFRDRCYLLIVSSKVPSSAILIERLGYQRGEYPLETKEYSQLFAKLTEGQKWMFRLKANPVRSGAADKTKGIMRGKVFAHVTPEQQKRWLFERAERYGFVLKHTEFDSVQDQWLKFSKRNTNTDVTIRAVTFEGMLTICNVDTFCQTLVKGIGRGKAYGCGMLTIAPYRDY